MPDLDPLRDLATQVRPPPFDSLMSTARRRNRRAAVAFGAAAFTAVILVLGAGAIVDRDDNRSAPGPAGTDTTDTVAEPVTDEVTEAVITHQVRVGRDPSNMAVDPGTGDVYVTNGADDTVSVIDTATHRVTDTIAVGHEPDDITIDPTTGLVYVSNGGGAEDADEDQWTGSVSVIDAETRQAEDTIVIGNRRWPSGLAVDPSTHSLFVACNADDTVAVIDTRTNEVVDTVQLGGSPLSVAVNPSASEAYVIAGKGISVIDTRTREVTHTVQASGGGFAVDPATGLIFVANEGDGTVTVLDASKREPVKVITVGGFGPFYVTLDPEATRAYITGAQDRTMVVLDTNSLEVVERIAFPGPDFVFARPVVHAATDSLYVILNAGEVGMMERR
jgi:YVTN family beta-propeller protein